MSPVGMGTKICIMSQEGRWCRCHLRGWDLIISRGSLPRDMMNMYPSQSSTSTYPLVNKQFDPENNTFLMETTVIFQVLFARVYVNLPEGTFTNPKDTVSVIPPKDRFFFPLCRSSVLEECVNQPP